MIGAIGIPIISKIKPEPKELTGVEKMFVEWKQADKSEDALTMFRRLWAENEDLQKLSNQTKIIEDKIVNIYAAKLI